MIVKEYGKSQYLYKRVGYFALSAIVMTFVALLCGCSDAEMTFNVDRINLVVGETRDLTPYAVFAPTSVKDRSFTLSTSDDCVKIRGTEVTATRGGTAVVTAEAFGKKSEIVVSCSYRDATWVVIGYDGDLVQTLDGDAETIKFTAGTGENVDPDCDIRWYVNGSFAENGKSFEFMPDGRGEYEVRARIMLGDTVKAEDATTVRIYAPTSVSGVSRGRIEQVRDFSPVNFCAFENIDLGNPVSTYEWRVNGSAAGSGRTFEFTPTAAGEYEITLYANGLKREIDGADSVTVSASGLRAPVGNVEFDGDGVKVVWRDGEFVKSIAITSPDGRRSVYSAGELTHAALFGRGEFDASEIINVCAEQPGTYRLRLTGDVAGAEFEFMQYPEQARRYIDDKIYLNNAFLSSADECGEFLTELYLTDARTGSAYISRELAPNAAIQAVTARAEQMRLDVECAVENSILTVNIGEYYNAPLHAEAVHTTQSLTMTPHLEYDAANHRGNGFVLPCERRREITVGNTEQLWYAVAHGYKPKITDITARTVYSRAKTVLLNIIGKDHTDAQKVHAIYDWVQWAAPKSATTDAGSASNFVDAVFIGANDGKAGVTREGAAKTVALLCGMEGIDCDLTDDPNKNTVTLDGEKYYIDIFAGKVEASATRDVCTHVGLFIPFDEFTKPITYCVQKHIYNGVYFDYYIDKSESSDADNVKAAVFYAFGGQNYNSVTIRDAFGTVIVSASEYGAEFMLAPELDAAELDAVAKNITNAVKAFGKTVGVDYSDGDVRIKQYGNIIAVSATKPTKETV